ncbi:GNAT family N-acetyltransferase [Amycolatopsis nigrescens]|uniref:GNAT family N-acetyltransferase n=1 Tax=Amycolatopsis nigrescens TaxID=381445 RepID=UPI00037AA20B|nr:GNAT family protein [Amycolatopsis nigrescens]
MINVEAFRDQPELRGERVVLKQVDETYADDYWRLLHDPEAIRLTGTHEVPARAEIEPWLAGKPGRDDRADWAILLAGDDTDGAFLGEVVLNEVDQHNESANFRIALTGPLAFGQGYGSEATSLVLDFAFSDAGLHRVALEVFDFNPRARRVYERCGFVTEGIRRDALRWDGTWHDAIAMSVLATDLPLR